MYFSDQANSNSSNSSNQDPCAVHTPGPGPWRHTPGPHPSHTPLVPNPRTIIICSPEPQIMIQFEECELQECAVELQEGEHHSEINISRENLSQLVGDQPRHRTTSNVSLQGTTATTTTTTEAVRISISSSKDICCRCCQQQ